MMRGRRGVVIGALAAAVALVPLSAGQTVVPDPLVRTFLGPRLVRAEVVLMEGGVPKLYRLDRGRVRDFTRSSITLRERDGTVVTVPVSPTVRVRVNGRLTGFAALRRGLWATTIRTGDAPVDRIEVTRP
jgi:hypothetical protein